MTIPEWPEFSKLPLDPDVEDWQQLSARLQKLLAAELAKAGAKPIWQPDANAEVMSSEALQGGLEDWMQHLLSAGFNPAHPGFMAYIPGGGLVTSALADWFVKTTNRYGTAQFASPYLARLEHRVIQTFAGWVGYDAEAAGVLTTGGSMANFTALVTARRAKLPENFLNGVLYCSDQAHHSVMKAANLAGFAKRNVHIVPTDAQFRMCVQPLREAIESDVAVGLTPFMVVASAGTTNTGSIDPLAEIAQVCQRHNLWYHVDGAYGGAFVITQEGQQKLVGMDQADSITLDPHKSLFLPDGTGCILVKDREALITNHEMRGDYMPDLDRDQAHLDPFSLSAELSREHRGLKIALPFMLHGVQAFREALEEKLVLGRRAWTGLQAIPRLTVLHSPDLTTVAFRLCDADSTDARNREVLERVNRKGRVFLSGTVLGGEFALRISVLSHRTHALQVDHALEDISLSLAEMFET